MIFYNLKIPLKRFFGSIPIYGKLLSAKKGSLKQGLTEVFLVVLFSLFPIWFYPVILATAYQKPILETIFYFLSSGELFLYSAALVGPLVYSIMKKYGESEESDFDREDKGSKGLGISFPKIPSIQFPDGIWFVLFSILICLFAATLFGMQRDSILLHDDEEVDNDSLFYASLIIYTITVSCYYCVVVYRTNLENASGEFGQDTHLLMTQWKEHNE